MMKFFDPKKKETNVGPSTAPDPPQPAVPVPPTPPRPAPAPVEPAAPTVSIPIPASPKPPEKPMQPALIEPKPASNLQRMSQTIFGPSVVVKGEISADETIIVDGTVEGSIETSRDVFIGSDGKVQANIRAANIIVSGKVRGDITATNKVEIAPYGTLEGDIRTPKLTISETSRFRGKVTMHSPEPISQAPKAEPDKKTTPETSPGAMEKTTLP